mgnify:CR=1 FL=1
MENRKRYILALKEKRLTYREIGELLNLSRQRIHQIITGYKSPPRHEFTEEEKKQRALELQSIKLEAKLNTEGLGHLTGREFSREAARRRDHYTCYICRKRWRVGQRRFDVHHLIGHGKSRTYDKVTEGGNLITLCHRCHLNLHYFSFKEKDQKPHICLQKKKGKWSKEARQRLREKWRTGLMGSVDKSVSVAS